MRREQRQDCTLAASSSAGSSTRTAASARTRAVTSSSTAAAAPSPTTSTWSCRTTATAPSSARTRRLPVQIDRRRLDLDWPDAGQQRPVAAHRRHRRSRQQRARLPAAGGFHRLRHLPPALDRVVAATSAPTSGGRGSTSTTWPPERHLPRPPAGPSFGCPRVADEPPAARQLPGLDVGRPVPVKTLERDASAWRRSRGDPAADGAGQPRAPILFRVRDRLPRPAAELRHLGRSVELRLYVPGRHLRRRLQQRRRTPNDSKAYGYWTDARNGRSSGGPGGSDRAPQAGRNPICEQADVMMDEY